MSSHLHSVCSVTDTPTTELYTLSLHDALPISVQRTSDSSILSPADSARVRRRPTTRPSAWGGIPPPGRRDRKSTRLNSSHEWISYAVFCLKKKNDRMVGADKRRRTARAAEPRG